jgi:rfaE bifunctional protein kinase chain/domain
MTSAFTSQKYQVRTVSLNASLKEALKKSVSKIKGKKILILGDVGLDEYVMGEVRRISPEAPVPVVDVETTDMRLGLAANVAQNIQSLGGIPYLVSVVGQDQGASFLKDLFQKNQVSTQYLVSDADRPTTRKTRVMAKHHHIVRVDYETRKYLSQETEEKLLQKVRQVLPEVDGVILEDYAKGVLSKGLMQKLVQLCHQAGKKVMVDPHRANVGEFYAGVDLLKPNFDEALALSGLNYDDLRDHPDRVYEVGRALQKKVGTQEIVMTRSKDGMTIFSGNEIIQVPTYARQVFDVTGAGDTVIAALALGLVAGLGLEQSCMLANMAAGVVVGQVGCVPCHENELLRYIEDQPYEGTL